MTDTAKTADSHVSVSAGRLAELERRLLAVEDESAIARLIATYGPLVDSGSGAQAAELWEPDGEYDVDPTPMRSSRSIEAMVRGDRHQAIITGGSAHLLAPHQITVDGDAAVAVGHSLLVVCAEGRFSVLRATAHQWLLRRGPQGWRVVRRVARLLDGREEARALLSLAANPLAATEDVGPGPDLVG